jgi:2'-5' RNA ligase
MNEEILQETETLRLFIAVEMPPEIVHEVKRIQEYFKQKNLFKGTYAHIDGAHITLKFLGDVNQSAVEKINQALKTITYARMHAQLSNLDVFTAGSHIKIIFVAVICPELAELAKKIDDALLPWFEPEKRQFHSHITIARVKSVEDREKLLHEVNNFHVNKLECTIDNFVLKKSVLNSAGPSYTDVANYELNHK